jgi:LytS/YehU family sensor histidine kinase
MAYSVLPPLQTINAFLEDTCVLVTLAYLLSRGPLLPRLFDRRRSRRDGALLALFFGLTGASDLLFPDARLPYVPSTLIMSLAGYVGGPGLGLLSAGVMAVPFALKTLDGGSPVRMAAAILCAFGAALIGAAVGRFGRRDAPLTGLLAGACVAGAGAEALRAGAHIFLPAMLPDGGFNVAANGFGCLLLTLVLHDAFERRQEAQRRLQGEREIAALRLTQLGELQARLHPHFLFNSLAAIAGLCVVRPSEAERAITDLAGLLRRFLHAPAEGNIPLREEMAMVRAYLSLEKLRMGDRLGIMEEVPEELLSCPIPRFCLQIPVENAVQHGLGPSARPGQIRIVARCHSVGHLFLAVIDSGQGEAQPLAVPTPEQPLHGLGLLAMRLRLSGTPPGRLRLSSRPGYGTLCALRLPL